MPATSKQPFNLTFICLKEREFCYFSANFRISGCLEVGS